MARWSTALLAFVLSAALAGEKPTLDRCAELVRDRPQELDSYMCYWFVSRGGDPAGAGRALESLLAIEPTNHRARLYLAAVEADLGHGRAEALYREAAEGFADWEEATGEVYARLSLCHLLQRSGRTEEADEELRRSASVAKASGDSILEARVWSFQASAATWRGAHGEAIRLLRQAERVAFPDGPVDVRSGILFRMGYAYWAQGLIEQALDAYTRQAEIMAEAGDPFEEANARINIAVLSVRLFDGGRMQLDDVLESLGKAAEMATRVGNRSAEARARMQLGRYDRSERGLAELERALTIYRGIGDRRGSRETVRQLAYALWEMKPERRDEAYRLLDEAIEDARTIGDLEDLARGLIGKAGIAQADGDRVVWISTYLSALEAVEKIRDLQPDGTVGARLFSRWAFAYSRFSGSLLQELSTSPDPEGDLDLAFRTSERMRSRVLIDELDSAGANPASDTGPESRRRTELLVEIARIQKRLADPGLAEEERAADLDSLRRLEMEEVVLRDAIARADPTFASLRSPMIPTLAEVQARLAPDQAMLSFQLSLGRAPGPGTIFHGGSWVLAVTADDVWAFAIPEEKDLREKVGVFLGLCRRRDGSDRDAAVWLFDDLLAEAMRAIGPSVRRLIVVPDYSLNRLPFAALRPGFGEDPLGATHEITQAPSASLWMKLRDSDGESAGSSVLALADPDLGESTGADSVRAATPWIEGLQLGSLPHARTEARSLVRAMGDESRVVSGAEASESFLKQTDLGTYRILHFAAHAVVDYEHPDRSAVVLARGGEDEDGFLQIREIVDLDLEGRVVILSACRSASGTLVRGEGTLGLARGFFRAGARAVIGNLWPLRDDDAELLVREMSRRLARGQNLAGALAGARSARLEAGAPAEAWAGLILLGDGDFVPHPEGRSRLEVLTVPVLVACGAVLLLLVAIVAYRRVRVPPSA
jgi:tetratricopeptide (TPR) repeat protein